MTELYRGNIRNHTVKEIEITTNGVNIAKSGNTIIKKDALFYKNISGKIVSFDYDTVLPSLEEAYIYATNQINKNQDNLQLASCVYVDDSELEFIKGVTRKELKDIKQEFRRK